MTEDVAIKTLWRQGAVPEWIDVSVFGETRETTRVDLKVCGRYTADDSLLYHIPEGYPPFHVLGPCPPVQYADGPRYSLYCRIKCWHLDDLEPLSPHRHKIGSLSLYGADFSDRVIANLPELPSLEVLELHDTSMEGSAMEALRRHRKLRVLRITRAHAGPFSLEKMPKLPTLETFDIAGLPARSWGFAHLEKAVPGVSRLALASEDELLIDGAFPPAASSVSLTGRNLSDGVKLPRQLEGLDLHLKEATCDQLVDWLATVESVQHLSLNNTPLDERTALRLAAQFRPKFLGLQNTGLRDGTIRHLATLYPAMRILSRLGLTLGPRP